ncbi:MAG: DUF4386 domain-containing protein [Sphaerobacteraceae bacterium]|nr:MAG: DUF4386 domain-containing protein [Sphaerobacteraceae bacterium]
MVDRISEASHHGYAKVAGLGLLLMAVLGLFGNFFVFESLITPGDAAETVSNLRSNEMLFRAGIAAFLLVAILDAIVAWALYVYFSPVNRNLALLAAWLRLIYTGILVIALSNHMGVLQRLDDARYSTALGVDQLNAQVMVLIDAFNNTWLVGLVVFGLHLLVLGYLMVTSGQMSRVVGVLLMIAGSGYLIDNWAQIILPVYQDYETLFLLVVAVPGVIGELTFAFWLVLRGARMPATQPDVQLSTP